MGYNSKVYRKQGGKELVVDNGKVLRTPAKHRALHESLPCLMPHPDAGLRGSVRQTDLQQTALREALHEFRIPHCVNANTQNNDEQDTE